MQNHVIDPAFFYDAIEEFAFNYDWYVEAGATINDLGNRVPSFDKRIIRGSLQSQGTSLRQSFNGNTEDMSYKFYCKSFYRISKGDFMNYKNRWLLVTAVEDYDEWGVRSVTLNMVNLNNYHDFQEYLKYINGEKIV